VLVGAVWWWNKGRVSYEIDPSNFLDEFFLPGLKATLIGTLGEIGEKLG